MLTRTKKALQESKTKKGFMYGILLVILVYAIGIIVNRIRFEWEFWDSDKDRGSIALEHDQFSEHFTTPVYLDQGWDESDSLWFYNTSQGSNLLPYDFFLVLEQSDNSNLFRSNDHIRKFRYLVQKQTFSNKEALPVGFAKDSYQDKEYLGFTCAACHTSQVNYKGKAVRIDGGPSHADMAGFMQNLGKALKATLHDKEKKKRFIDNVLTINGDNFIFTGSDSYDDAEEIISDLVKYERQINNYNDLNHSDTDYGYARLDAFGRIYNRVAEHMVNESTLEKVLENAVGTERTQDLLHILKQEDAGDAHLVDRVTAKLDKTERENLFKVLYSKADAPVSYPFLWDIVQHDYLQWNGIVDNSGLGPIGRNVGQVIGVFGTLDWEEKYGFSLSAFIGKQDLASKYTSYQSSINVRNLYRVEKLLKELQSPKWPEEVLGAIDYTRMKRGKKIYQEYCQACHHLIKHDDEDRKVVAHMSHIDRVGTDPKMARNSVQKLGYAGTVEGQYLNTGVGKVLLAEKAPVAELLTAVTVNVVATPDMDKNWIVRWSDWIYDLFFAYIENPVESTIKKGDYIADTTASPYASLLSYKARPLNGIWATAPYLHNGSVPSLYDLLLPKKMANDIAGDFRPDLFKIGSREFDPVKVGFRVSGFDGFVFDTSLSGNANSGHEYAAGRTLLSDGTKLEPLNKEQRLDLLEYLKTL